MARSTAESQAAQTEADVSASRNEAEGVGMSTAQLERGVVERLVRQALSAKLRTACNAELR